MKIVTTRRVSQVFFLALTLWFAVVATPGEAPWQLRGWPVGWLLELDPLIALATALATGVLFAGLLWSLLTVALTLLFGRAFCGWVCPLGTLQQAVGWLAARGRSTRARIDRNRPHRAQAVKYVLLVWLLVAAVGAFGGGGDGGAWFASLQVGLLDPLSLVTRAVDLAVVPLADVPVGLVSLDPRHVVGGLLVGGVFVAVLVAAVRTPRFYCRFVCPLGALLGLLSRVSLWRVGRTDPPDAVRCTSCGRCDRDCEGACDPSGAIRWSECVVCLNCLGGCEDGLMAFRTTRSAAGEVPGPDVSRRAVVSAAVVGLVTTPLARLAGPRAEEGRVAVLRPPGALAETDFLARCVKCGLCMRVCPTNVLQPALFAAGAEGLWTPVLDNRAGTSGCQPACVACSRVCPTGALRPLALDEKLGKGAFAEAGPVRLGTAFVDRGRCLPWGMDTPCIVCEENCPTSPKAIHLRETLLPLRDGRRHVTGVPGGGLAGGAVAGGAVALDGPPLAPGSLGPRDHRLRTADGARHAIAGNDASSVSLGAGAAAGLAVGDEVTLEVRLRRPYVEPARCTGCGICEHVCPVAGRAGIRVTAEGESRDPRRRLVLRRRDG